MTDDELRHLLGSHSLPPAEQDVRGRALDRALTALRNAPRHRMPPALAWWPGLAAAAAILLLAAVFWRTNDASGALFSEMEALFGGHLAAVVVGDEVGILMAEGNVPRPADQRVRIEIVDGPSRLVVLTYSGNRICLPFGGETLCFTPLLTGSDEVIVVPETSGTPDQLPRMIGRRMNGGT